MSDFILGAVFGGILGSFTTHHVRDWRARQAQQRKREQLVAEVAPMVLASIRTHGLEWTTAATHWSEIKRYAHGTPAESLEAVVVVLRRLKDGGELEMRTGRALWGSIAPTEFRPVRCLEDHD